MEIAKNLVVICQYQDGAYNCTISLYDAWTQTWEDNIPYCARHGDPAPVNVWIINQIDSGACGTIDACPIPPESPAPSEVSGDGGPTVI